jgi:hypothetical protein
LDATLDKNLNEGAAFFAELSTANRSGGSISWFEPPTDKQAEFDNLAGRPSWAPSEFENVRSASLWRTGNSTQSGGTLD